MSLSLLATPPPPGGDSGLLAELGPGIWSELPRPHDPPLVLGPEGGALAREVDAAADWFASRAATVDRLLARHGAILLRGFPIADTDDFARLVAHYPAHGTGYTGGATPRNAIKGTVYEATQVPGSIVILLHQEMAYLHDFPTKIIFFCARPPDEGGETTFGDFRRFMNGLPERFLDELAERGLAYHRHFRPAGVPHGVDAHPEIYHATLSQAFGTEDRDRIEEHCGRLGMEIEWEEDGGLRTRLVRDAFATHGVTGDRVYFNHILTQIIDPDWMGPLYEPYLDLYDRADRPRPYHVTYADGGQIAPEDYLRVREGLAAVTREHPWQAGDVLVIDNVYTGHGRRTFRGSRDLQVALVD